jgi:hypothetical protein
VRLAARAQLTLAALLLQGCIFVPRTTAAYDEACRTETKQMHLEAAQIGALGHCTQKDCAVALVAFGAVAAASAVVSGSIVVVGNVVYWIEKQGRCALA